MNTEWRKSHEAVISSFLESLNEVSDDYVLKGGTSLMVCYGLDRFSEDIDLDSMNHGAIRGIIDSFCKKNGYSYRISKNTDTTQRYFIHYGNEQKPLKIEISFRKKNINKEAIKKINGIQVYDINEICMMKLNAYIGRDKIRDLYDIAFITKNYWDNLMPLAKNALTNALEYKGLEHFDYIIREQKDELIDNNKLAEDFLNMFDSLGLLADREERELLKSSDKKR